MSTQPTPLLTLLDGGMGRLLERNGVSIKSSTTASSQSMRVNVEQPESVVKAHKQFLQAGARIITTNSYACVPNTVASAVVELKGGSSEGMDFDDTLRSNETDSTVSGTEHSFYQNRNSMSSSSLSGLANSNPFYQNKNNGSTNSISSLASMASQKSTESTFSFKDTTRQILPLKSYIEAAGKCALQARREFRSMKRRNSSVENIKEKFSGSQALGRSSTVSELGAPTANSQPIRIAGCIPSLGIPSQSFDEDFPEKNVLINDYTMIANTIATYSDLFLAEMMSSIREVMVVCEVLIDYNRGRWKSGHGAKPIFISFTLDDSVISGGTSEGDYETVVPRLRYKEKLDDAVLAVLDMFAKSKATEMLGAILVNCSSIDNVNKGIECLSGFFVNKKDEFFFEDFQHVQFGGYANVSDSVAPVVPDTKLNRAVNSGFGENAEGSSTNENIVNHSHFFRSAQKWRRNYGASMIGGCCGVYPEHIAELSDLLCEEEVSGGE